MSSAEDLRRERKSICTIVATASELLATLSSRLGKFNWACVPLWPASIALGVRLVSISTLRIQAGTGLAVSALEFAQIEPERWAFFGTCSPLAFSHRWLAIILQALSDFPDLMFWVSSALTITQTYITIKKRSLNPPLLVRVYRRRFA